MAKYYRHENVGTCSASVEFEVEESTAGLPGIIRKVRFEGGCSGNLQGISALVEGMSIPEAAKRLSGIRCGDSDTSCPDQLAKAIAELQKAAGSLS